MTDTPTGHDRAPDRYTGQGRETIDRMRDLAHAMDSSPRWAFAYHCLATALKYRDRAGRKGSESEDLAKMSWYQAMAAHAIDSDRHPDPRSGRPDFVPYKPQPLPEDLTAWVRGPHARAPEYVPPPQVPDVVAVAKYGPLWWRGDEVVKVEIDRLSDPWWTPHGSTRCYPVDPTDDWGGPVQPRRRSVLPVAP